jgi:gentisate 1,2-dioxygenase
MTTKKQTYFDLLLKERDKERRRREAAEPVIKGSARPLETTPLGRLKWYMHPAIEDTPTKFSIFFLLEIPPLGKSGKMVVPGGQVIYFWQGRGYTLLDGETFSWEKDDVLQLPIRQNGVTFQHFNTDKDQTAKLIVIEPNTIGALGVEKGSRFEVLEDAPKEFLRRRGCGAHA